MSHQCKRRKLNFEENSSITKIYYKSENSYPEDRYTNSDFRYNLIKDDHIKNRYQIIKYLGQGAFSNVIKCKDHKEDKDVAVKISINHKNFEEQTRIEISILEILKELNHENVIKLYESFSFRNHSFLVFDVYKEDLLQFISRKKSISIEEIKNISKQIFEGVNAFHSMRPAITHADLKPENIMYDNGKVIITDFGISFSERNIKNIYLQSRWFRAPEILLQLNFDKSIDIWSVGCIIFSLYNKGVIFKGKDCLDQLYKIMKITGVPNEELIEKSPAKKHYFNDDNQPFIEIEIEKLDKYIKDATLVDLLMKCFIFQSEDRITAEDALKHEFYA